MQKKNLLIALVLGAVALVQVGCSEYSYTSRSTTVDRRTVSSSEAVADLRIDYKKKVTATSNLLKMASQAKQQAIYQCIMNNGIDVLVDPIFQIEKHGKKYRATVNGFAGYYEVGKDGLDQVIEKQYKQEDIEKYLLLTNPDFYKFYYRNSKGGGNVYYIHCNEKSAVKAAPASVVNLPKAKKAPKEKKGLFGFLKKKNEI